jgi:spermidine synthase
VKTKFQRVDIYDTIDPRFNSLENYLKSLSSDNPYYSENKECFAPDRSLFLDGILQSSSKGERAYHEALVHPALFIHPNPSRVGIVGGGEGATLREVLKHKTVEEAIMIEIDEQLVSLCRQYLKSWNDCSDIEGSAAWCGNDKRAKLIFEDALAWFIERFYDQTKVVHETFDVIIMDAL